MASKKNSSLFANESMMRTISTDGRGLGFDRISVSAIGLFFVGLNRRIRIARLIIVAGPEG